MVKFSSHLRTRMRGMKKLTKLCIFRRYQHLVYTLKSKLDLSLKLIAKSNLRKSQQWVPFLSTRIKQAFYR
jgi:hypothetical protein